MVQYHDNVNPPPSQPAVNAGSYWARLGELLQGYLGQICRALARTPITLTITSTPITPMPGGPNAAAPASTMTSIQLTLNGDPNRPQD